MKGAPGSGKSFAEVAAYAYVPCRCRAGLEPGLSDEAFFEPTEQHLPVRLPHRHARNRPRHRRTEAAKLVAVDDAGTLINPMIVEGQIHGGLAQGIGQAMIEEVVYDEDGQLITGSFMDYAHAPRHRFPVVRAGRHRDAHACQPARRKGRRRGRHARLDALHRQRRGRRAERVRRKAHRHDAPAGEALAHHPRRPGVIPTEFDYQRATSLDDAMAKLRRQRRASSSPAATA